MDSKLPIDILENVIQLAIEGCKAIANYIREVRTHSHFCDYTKRSQSIVYINFFVHCRFYWRTQNNLSIDEVYSFIVAEVMFPIDCHITLVYAYAWLLLPKVMFFFQICRFNPTAFVFFFSFHFGWEFSCILLFFCIMFFVYHKSLKIRRLVKQMKN